MKRKGRTNNKDLPGGGSSRKSKSSLQKSLPVFDFSKRSHQAAFWMLLNTVVYGKPDGSFMTREMAPHKR